jgi:small subunit ribosomal protein S17
MAESEETTENVEEVSSKATAEATASEETTTADDTGTRKERNAAKRAAKAKPAANAPRTLEDRLAGRAAHKERNARQRRAYRAKQKLKRAEVREAAPAESAEDQHAPDHGPGRPKVRQGIVVSSKPHKTITVRVDIARRHKRYHKILRSSVTLHAHDESNNANAGDTVRIQECRPMSRMKRWRLLDVLERAR